MLFETFKHRDAIHDVRLVPFCENADLEKGRFKPVAWRNGVKMALEPRAPNYFGPVLRISIRRSRSNFKKKTALPCVVLLF